MKILFLCNANLKSGLGHINRCRIIANSLYKSVDGLEIFFSGDIDTNLINLLSFEHINIISSPRYGDFDCVILDSYDQIHLNTVNKLDTKKIAIDDRELQNYEDWDLVLNFRIKPEYLRYKSKDVGVGASFFPFDNKYKILRNQAQEKKEFKNLFFYFGETQKIKIDKVSENLIQENSNKYNFFISSINDLSVSNFYKITKNNFFKLFSRADVVVTGGGLTKYEAAFCKKINLIFSLNKLQKNDTEILSEFFLSNDMGYFKDFNNSLLESLEKLENIQSDEIELFYANSSKYFDTKSLDNVTKKITSIVT